MEQAGRNLTLCHSFRSVTSVCSVNHQSKPHRCQGVYLCVCICWNGFELAWGVLILLCGACVIDFQQLLSLRTSAPALRQVTPG